MTLDFLFKVTLKSQKETAFNIFPNDFQTTTLIHTKRTKQNLHAKTKKWL